MRGSRATTTGPMRIAPRILIVEKMRIAGSSRNTGQRPNIAGDGEIRSISYPACRSAAQMLSR